MESDLNDITNQPQPNEEDGKKPKGKHHLIKPRWLRIILKTIGCLILFVLLIPVLLYVPPVQTFIKDIACKIVRNSTGMDISIDRFRLKWPLDVSLQGVSVVEATGDTMVNAKEVILDVKLMPLFKLDVDVQKLELDDGYFRMVAPDSSMTLKVRAGLLTAGSATSINIKTGAIDLDDVLIRNGNLSLMMDVYRKKETPNDTTPTPFKITANNIRLENFGFEMSMLPTIDTLVFHTQLVELRNGIVDLPQNKITAQYLGTSDGNVTFITPTPEYVKTHPVPETPDSLNVPSPPMIIVGDTVSVTGFKALYATKGAKPMPGFDPSYISLAGINIMLNGFYNEASDIKLPITRLEARERSGLEIVRGSGTVGIDSIGLNISDFELATLYSRLNANASVPFEVMAMNPKALFDVKANGAIGMPDVEAFMPSLKKMLSVIPGRKPLEFDISAYGAISDIRLPELKVALPGVLSLSASGNAANVLNFKKLAANVQFTGNLSNPTVVEKLINLKDFSLPTLKINGKASVENQNYAADFDLRTSSGDVAATGKVGLNSETYNIDVNVNHLNVGNFLPDLGIGTVTASLSCVGNGFNPIQPKASTDIDLSVVSLVLNDLLLKNIDAKATLHDHDFKVSLTSDNQFADFDIDVVGSIYPDLYKADLTADLRNVDLHDMGLTPEKNGGKGVINLVATASPNQWLYDIALNLSDTEWTIGEEYINIPGDLALNFKSTLNSVAADLNVLMTSIDFESGVGLKQLVSSFTTVADSVTRQIKERDLNIEGLQKSLPPFNLAMNVSGRGAVGQYLNSIGLSMDTIFGNLGNDSIIHARLEAIELGNADMQADTLTMALQQRGTLLDYRLHMGNRKNNPLAAEFADVNVNGYLGQNRLMVGINQKNLKGETGYRLGLTGAFLDSVISVHFTPLKATIGYIPWQINADNYIDFNPRNYHVAADLQAQSAESAIVLQTVEGKRGNDELHVELNNIKIQDFLQLSVFAPPLTASLNANLNVGYTNNWLYGNGNVGVRDFTYDKMKVGNFDLGFRAGLNDEGKTGASATLIVDGDSTLTARMLLEPDTLGAPQVKRMDLDITRFPLSVANAFLGKDVMSLKGYLNGGFNLKGTFSAPILNGYLACDSVSLFIPMIGSSLKFNQDSILVADNVIKLKDFDIVGANENPLVISGSVDATDFKNISLDLAMHANRFMAINNTAKAKSDLYGKLLMNLDASARGVLQHFSINANATILSETDLTYSIPQITAQLTQQDASKVVRFVNFNEPEKVSKEDSVPQSIAMRIVANLTLEPGMKVGVIYPGTTITGSGRGELSPSGSLNYFQNYMGDMRLNGRLELGNGYAKYNVPVFGEKRFNFDPASYVLWNGDIMNPVLSISATDEVKTSVIENGNSRLVNFLVGVSLSNTLSAPKLEFDLNTDDDLSIRNDLMSMSADQRSMAAINLLLTGQYSGIGGKTASSDLLQNNVYGLLTNSVNGWLANHVKGVDLSLGVDQYDRMVNGESGTATSYSYTMSKSLFDNKFKISVGGNYTTDASADENFSENLISDISFEYMLKQTSNVTMLVKLFRHTGYESILEGEVTETGVGFSLKRRLATLKDLFKWSTYFPMSGRNQMLPGMPQTTRPVEKKDSVKETDNKKQ